MSAIGPKKPILTMQNIMLKYGRDYRSSHPMPYAAHGVLNAIERCHTPALGAHVIRCQTPECGYEKVAYNSCRNRHCPGCQGSQSARWVGQREGELLPVPYFHVCFTLPHELNLLVLANKKILYDCLFTAAWEAMSMLFESCKDFAGQGGAIAVLHTWGQNLMDHPHVHMIVPGGALNKEKRLFRQRRLRRNKNGLKAKDFLVPVGPLRILFKNKFLAKLGKTYKEGALIFPGMVEALAMPNKFYELKDNLYVKNWVVYCKEPFAGPKQVLAYLGRYTHRVAISNSRLLNMEGGKVTFKLKNYRKEGAREVMVLPADDFIRRFLLHVLPKGYRRIRMFGFLSNRYKQKNLETIRALLSGEPVKAVDEKELVDEKKEKPSVAEVILKSTGVDIRLCPKCGQCGLQLIRQLMHGSG
jgi:Putative transposase/Transposase zinc-binding domain